MSIKPKSGISMETLERCAAAFRVLSHAHRLKIVELLAEHDLAVGELADRLGLSQAACSQHLNLMRAHGLLAARRDGKTVYYEVANPSALKILECIRKQEA